MFKKFSDVGLAEELRTFATPHGLNYPALHSVDVAIDSWISCVGTTGAPRDDTVNFVAVAI